MTAFDASAMPTLRWHLSNGRRRYGRHCKGLLARPCKETAMPDQLDHGNSRKNGRFRLLTAARRNAIPIAFLVVAQ